MRGQWIIKEVYFEDGFPKIIRDLKPETPYTTLTEREESAGKPTNSEAQLPNGKAMTDRELMDKAWDYLASYTVGERPNASEVNDFIAVIEDRMNQPEQELMIDCPRCGHCCPHRPWVGLTMLDMAELRRSGLHAISDKHFQAIESKLREKNHE